MEKKPPGERRSHPCCFYYCVFPCLWACLFCIRARVRLCVAVTSCVIRSVVRLPPSPKSQHPTDRCAGLSFLSLCVSEEPFSVCVCVCAILYVPHCSGRGNALPEALVCVVYVVSAAVLGPALLSDPLPDVYVIVLIVYFFQYFVYVCLKHGEGGNGMAGRWKLKPLGVFPIMRQRQTHLS